MRPQDARDVSVWGETLMDTWGKLWKVQFPTKIPLVASHRLLTGPNQPIHEGWKINKYIKSHKIASNDGQKALVLCYTSWSGIHSDQFKMRYYALFKWYQVIRREWDYSKMGVWRNPSYSNGFRLPKLSIQSTRLVNMKIRIEGQ